MPYVRTLILISIRSGPDCCWKLERGSEMSASGYESVPLCFYNDFSWGKEERDDVV